MSAQALRIGVFGASFNPPHWGHWDAVMQVLAADQVDQVLAIPSYSHALKDGLMDYDLRLRMTRTLFAEDTAVCVEDLERPLARQLKKDGEPIYTWDVLMYLRRRNPAVEWVLIIGPDVAHPSTWSRFYRHEQIAQEFAIEVVAQRLQTRSSLIRGQRNTEGLLPERVQALYRWAGATRSAARADSAS